MNAVIFARVSTREQAEEGYSLSQQVKLLRDYAKQKEFVIVQEFEVPESASGKQERKHFRAMLDSARQQGITIILAEKADRITRNLRDAVTIGDWIEENAQHQLHLVKESMIIHQGSKSHEKFMFDIKVVLAKQYAANLGEEVKKGLAGCLAQGRKPGPPPLGYTTVLAEGRKAHVPDEARAPLIKQAFEQFSLGRHSVRSLAKWLRQEGLTTKLGGHLGGARLHAMLTDPFYVGMIRHKGALYPGRHTPLVSQGVYNKVHDLLRQRTSASRFRKHMPLFKGLLRCKHCQGLVTWELQKGHWYGHCNRYRRCPERRFVRQEVLHEQLVEALDALSIKDPKLMDWLVRALKESHADKKAYHEKLYQDLKARYEKVQKRVDLLYDDKLDGGITKDLYQRKFVQYVQQQQELVTAMDKHQAAGQRYLELGSKILEVAQKAKALFMARSDSEKRQLLGLIFSNLTLDGRKLEYTYKKAFSVLADYSKSGDWLTLRDVIRTGEWDSLIDDPNSFLMLTDQLLLAA